MSQVQATMGITKDSMSKVDGQSVNTMDTLSKLAKKMGAETAFSASECAEALNYLALAGYDTQQMCDTLPTVLNLAASVATAVFSSVINLGIGAGTLFGGIVCTNAGIGSIGYAGSFFSVAALIICFFFLSASVPGENAEH